MANATVEKWAMYKIVKIGIYNGFKGQPIELYDCGKAYIPPPPKPLTPEQIAAAKAKAEVSKKSGAAAALKSNLDAAAKGDAYGLLRMGQRYRDGDGVEKDLVKAKEYLQKSADAGSPTAKEELSKLNQP
jgi:TPR repeat protein